MVWNTAIGGALIAAGASALSLINSKETKISEFRQQWIDALREDLAILITAAIDIQGELNGDNVKLNNALDKANLVATRIGLRLNGSEPQAQDLLDKLAHLRNSLHDVEVVLSQTSFEEVQKRATTAIAAGQLLLKAEWNRVKRGEPTYVLTHRLALGCIIFLAALLFVDYIRPDVIDKATRALRCFAGYSK